MLTIFFWGRILKDCISQKEIENRYCTASCYRVAKVSNTAHGLFHPKCKEIQKIKFVIRWYLSSFVTSSNDLTNQRLLRHVISGDYITHEFRVIPKQLYCVHVLH